MAAITHYVKQDDTSRTTTGTSAAEETNYTVAWATLTGAGFANSDDVLVFVAVKMGNSANSNNTSFQVGFGTTYAGRTDVEDSLCRWECPGAGDRVQYTWIDRRTLVTGENIYFSTWGTAGTSAYINFRLVVLKLGDLTANDFAYADATHTGDAPTSYGTTGAGISTPAAGDWFFIAVTHWLEDSTSVDQFMAINDGTSDISECNFSAEDTADEYQVGTYAYKEDFGAGITVRVRFKAASVNDCTRTAIFGLRLDAFVDHWGAHTTNTITHTDQDILQTFASNASYSLTNNGPFIMFGWPIHGVPSPNQLPYGVQNINGSRWPSAYSDAYITDNASDTSLVGPLTMGYAAVVSAGSKNIVMQCAAATNTIATFDCVEQVAAAFSLMLVGGVAFSPYWYQYKDAIYRFQQ